jgi:hypothetical protein
MRYRSSRDAALLLGISPSRLARAIWDRRLDPPERGPGGAFLWDDADIQRASWLLRGRGADHVLAVKAGGGPSDCCYPAPTGSPRQGSPCGVAQQPFGTEMAPSGTVRHVGRSFPNTSIEEAQRQGDGNV